MSGGAASPSFYSFMNDLGEDNPAIRSLRQSFKALSRACSNIQILQLAQIFRQWSDGEIIRWAEESRPHPSSASSSKRTSGFSIQSRLSQATTVSNRSQPPLPTPPPQYQIWPPPQLPLPELAELVNQDSPISIGKGSAAGYICIACNRPCKNKSSLSRHQMQHCEREEEWFCSLCVPRKRFYRRDKLSIHHIKNHGTACVAGCKEQQGGGLCKEHLSHSRVAAWPKKAWGCPCCVQYFDTLAAWTAHSLSHPVENGSVVGWSLSTMVQSLLLQPSIKEAAAELPWQTCDLAKVNADVCLGLKEVLERHQLSKAVHDHYDFRHLQLPEKLAHYAFRLLTNGEMSLDEVSNVASGAGTGEAELFYNRHRAQMPAPVFNVSGSAAPSYWGSEDPSVYDENAHQSVETAHVHESQNAQLLSNASEALFTANGLSATEPVFGGSSLHSCDQVLQNSSDILSNGQTSSLASVGILSNALQEPSYNKNVHHDLSMQKSSKSLVHPPSSANFIPLNTKPLPLAPPPTDGTHRSRSGDRHGRRRSRSLSPSSERRRDDYYSLEEGDYPRDQTPIPALSNTMAPELSEPTAADDYNTDLAMTEPTEADLMLPPLPYLSWRMSGIRSHDWLMGEPDEPYNP